MDFFERLAVAKWMLRKQGRISYATLKREFGLDDGALDNLRYELIVGQRIASDENDEVLVWQGGSGQSEALPAKANSAGLSEAEAERRQLTVMFCDLVGSTALSTKFDPEDLRELITAFQDHCRKAIEHFQGFVARYMGDGLLVYFGYPQAHEDDAERAVRTALEIVSSMQDINTGIGQQHKVTLAVRVGVATGPVVVGDIVGEGAAEEAAVVGETPNLAARLQGIAMPDQVVVAQATHRLLGHMFEYEDLGRHELKGIEHPVQVWRVVRESDIDGRYEARRMGGRLPLIGRQEELGLLVRSWEAAKRGHGQAALVQGDAGIGKSRLLEALREHVADEEHLWAVARCSPYHSTSALYPIIEHLKRAMGWQQEDSAGKKLEKLESALQEQSHPLEEVVPLYAELLSLTLPEGRYEALDLSPRQKRVATLDAIAGWLLDMAENTPVVYVWEDLHWGDPTTLELLGICIEQSPTVSMLNVLTYRPEFSPPWVMHSNMTPIALNRLERPEVEVLIGHQAGGKLVPPAVIEHVVEKADGVPLYAEELTKTILDSEYLEEDADRYTLAGSLSDMAIPATLQDSLMARLDRLPTLREIAQLGAVLGREFAYQMLCFLTSREEDVVRKSLEKLVEDELLYQRGRPPRSKYVFKHALIQDAAYHSLLKRTRQQYHRQIAQMLEKSFAETVVTNPELVAHHYQEAGMAREAIDYWYLAGERARQRSANQEAMTHLYSGIALIPGLQDGEDRARYELKLQFSLGGIYLQMKGHSAPEVESAFARARELCLRVGDSPELVPTLFGLWRTYVVQMADCNKPRDVAAQLLRLAEEEENAVSRVVAHYAMGFTAYVMGRFSEARRHFKESLRLYSPDDRDTAAVYRFGQDPGVACLCYLALTEWALGCTDQSLAYARDGVLRAEQLEDPFSIAFSLVITSLLDQSLGDADAALRKASKAIKLAEEKGYPYWAEFGSVMQGWATAAKDPGATRVSELRDRVENHRSLGTELFSTYFLTLLGEVSLAANLYDGCEAALEKAESLLGVIGERCWESEVYRLRGELVVAKEGDLEEAEASFRKALAIARERNTKSLELRAAMSIARFWRGLGRAEEARELLSEIYRWFEQGVETVDLAHAKRLLDEQ